MEAHNGEISGIICMREAPLVVTCGQDWMIQVIQTPPRLNPRIPCEVPSFVFLRTV